MIFTFDAFELDIPRRELRRGGVPVPIEPQVFALLHLLVEERDRALSKDEIIDRIWSGRVISDAALSSRIKSVRQALGDDGESQRFLKTLRGHGFRFVGMVGEAEPPHSSTAAIAADLAQVMARPLIAVFPFEQDGTLPEDAYFANGVAENLIAELSAWRWFPVLSRNATFDPAKQALPLIERAAALGARYAVSGRIARLDRRARLTVELCDVASGVQLWSVTLERERHELLAMQEQIGTEIFRRISPELDSAERRRILRKPPADFTAWDLTLKALWALSEPTRETLVDALQHLETAARLDPGASLPWSLLALTHYEAGLKNWVDGDTTSARDQFRGMLDAARQAIELDPGGWMGHSLASAGELFWASSYRQARFHADQAISLNPSAGLAHHLSGCIFGFGGYPAEAIAVQTQVYQVDPAYRHSDVIEADLGLWNFLLGDLDAARHHLQAALIAQPGNIRAHQRLAAVLAQAGDRSSAREELELLRGIGAMPTRDYIIASYPFQDGDHAHRFRTALSHAGVAMD